MRFRRNAARESFDVVFYAPWAASLIPGSTSRATAGGAETQLLLLASGLAQRGLTVAMVVIGGAGELPAEAQGVRILRQRRRRRLPAPLSRAGLALGALRSLASIRTEVFVHRNAGPTTAVVALVARLREARFVCSTSSVVDFEFGALEKRALNVRLYEWGVRRASQIVVQTDEQARLCRARFGRESVVVRSIATRSRPRSGRPEAFLWAGRLESMKRPEAYVELARAVPEAHFWMIGVPTPDELTGLRRRVQDAAAELPNLELLQPRSRAGVGHLLDRAVAVVSTAEREGLPNLFLEAWSRGVPALTLSFDPDGVIARHELGSVAGGDRSTLEEQARHLWRGRDDQAGLAARCIAYVRAEHDEDAVVDRWRQAILRVS